jgi:hypothetical protein
MHLQSPLITPPVNMSSARTLKIRRSATGTEVVPGPVPMVNDLLKGEVPVSSARGATKRFTADGYEVLTPMELPFDRQCIIRFPPGVAPVIRQLLSKSNELTEIIRVTVEHELVDGYQFRVYCVSVFDKQLELTQYQMKGVLVDLPTFVESYKTMNSGASLTKSGDVSQMLMCFPKSEFDPPYSAEVQKVISNLMYPSGLTPPTSGIRHRKFRAPPSQQDVQNLSAAEDVIENALSGGALEWVIETQVPEEEAVARAINEPDNIWNPTEEMLFQLRKAGYIDENGDIVEAREELFQPEEPPQGGKSLVFTRRA